ncbi:hypothetical protein GCM10028790_20280 [Micromonospora taraxaci]|uniref:Uncharacterized protein n=1 Tax=Micromonospora taraxaci TaxID=1316803 RepID=A0A561W580_9ACTN|nr:hypothetical protein [Micromonospora taraxaci]TWG19036.1 hypothetical protein FHU34_114411 [Micromonospora taraxaci]
MWWRDGGYARAAADGSGRSGPRLPAPPATPPRCPYTASARPVAAGWGACGSAAPVPEPFATLLRQLVDAAGPPPALLFPSRLAGQPVAYTTLHNRLRTLEFPIKEARVAALRQLVLQAPAPVVADALGFHPTTATRQVTNAGGTWSRYPSPRS